MTDTGVFTAVKATGKNTVGMQHPLHVHVYQALVFIFDMLKNVMRLARGSQNCYRVQVWDVYVEIYVGYIG